MINDGFSIITVTNRDFCINNLFRNYYNQLFPTKELIIIINSDELNINDFSNYIKDNNIKIFKLPSIATLGECLNFGIEKCNYRFIAKFDDDDYYGPYYLNEYYKLFSYNQCDIIGKSRTYYYLEKNKQLMLKKIGSENKYTKSIMGSTICFKKYIFNSVKFKNISSREDYHFNKDCINNGYKIFSSSSYNHIVFKHSDNNKHTFLSNIDILIDRCDVILSNISFSDCFKIVDENKKMS